jgi:hypothetical protein
MEPIIPDGGAFSGAPIAPGIHHGVPECRYRPAPALNVSILQAAKKSPGHLRHAMDTPPGPPTEAMAFGSAIHARILEPDRSADMIDDDPPSTGPTSKAWKEYAARVHAEGLIPWHHGWSDQMNRMVDAFNRNRECVDLLTRRGAREATVVGPWSERYPVLCKGKLDLSDETADLYQFAGGLICDLKTTREWGDYGWRKAMTEFHYPARFAMYRRLVQNLTGGRPRCFVMWGHKSPPYCWAVREVDEDSLAMGAKRMEEWLNVFMRSWRRHLEGLPSGEAWPTDTGTRRDKSGRTLYATTGYSSWYLKQHQSEGID